MLFHSVSFIALFSLVFLVYIRIKKNSQNRLLLAASLFFYGFWDWRFLGLLLGVCAVNYFCGLWIAKTRSWRRRKVLLGLSVITNLGVLGFFKYADFFTESLQNLMSFLGFRIPELALHVVLPVGISFYIFQAMSYAVDVYRRTIRPCTSFQDFSLYISFFPQLVAGPIERAGHLMMQLTSERRVDWDRVSRGSFLFFWGMYEKICVADPLARQVDAIFAQASWTGPQVLWALYGFAVQIFCDFDGYSNMAKGLACCLGFDLIDNFRFPYFSKSPKEFWGSWHISLSTWLRDYLYIPLGGNTSGSWKTVRNLMLTMMLGGLWHGASWTFVLWGAYHGLLLVAYRFFCQCRQMLRAESLGETSQLEETLLSKALKQIIFFNLVCFGWLFFRAGSFSQIVEMTAALFLNWTHPWESISLGAQFLMTAGLFVILHSICYWQNNPMALYHFRNRVKSILYAILFYSIIFGRALGAKPFIYFQF